MKLVDSLEAGSRRTEFESQLLVVGTSESIEVVVHSESKRCQLILACLLKRLHIGLLILFIWCHERHLGPFLLFSLWDPASTIRSCSEVKLATA